MVDWATVAEAEAVINTIEDALREIVQSYKGVHSRYRYEIDDYTMSALRAALAAIVLAKEERS